MEMSFVNSCRHLPILIISINTKPCHYLTFIPKSKSQREVKKKNVREKKNFFFLRVFGIGLRENYLESLGIFSYYNEKIINRFLRYN